MMVPLHFVTEITGIYLLPCPLKLLLEVRQLGPAALQLLNVRLQNKFNNAQIRRAL
jgi:hypothetical protein